MRLLRPIDKGAWPIMTDGKAEQAAGSAGASTVFFSYSREDQARALPIIRMIEKAGYDVWWDGLLEGGDRFSHTTEAALNRAQVVVVLWSKTSVASHWVHDEATAGRDRRILLPLSLDGSEPPLGFKQFQVIDLSLTKMRPQSREVQQVLRALATMHGQSPPPVVPHPVPFAPPIGRRTLLAGGVTAVVVAGGWAAWQFGLVGGDTNPANRIAVLPFANQTGDPKQAYLSDGLATEIRSILAQNGALQVMGQASSDTFKDKKQDLVSIAKKLRVDFLLDGSMQLADNVLRITIELIDGKTGMNRLPRSFEKALDNPLAVQREIANAISAELTSKIGAVGSKTKIPGGTSNVIAFDHYLRGKDLYANAEDESQQREAVTQFDAAIAADPKFAAAYAARARSLAAVAGQYGSADEIKFYHDAALESAHRAIALAPDLADAQSSLALSLFQGDLNVTAARKPFDLSRKLGEGEAPVMARFAFYAAATGRDREAVSAIERALTLDPLNALVHRLAGTVHYAAGRYDQAMSHLRETLKIKADLSETRARIGMVLLAQNKNSEALKEFGLETHKWSKLAGVAIAQHRLGNMAAAKEAMVGLTSDIDVVSFYQQGQVLAQWGDVDAAIAKLKLAFEQHDAGLTAARYDPVLNPLRAQPDFKLLLKSMGFD
jgi:TolB-like protein